METPTPPSVNQTPTPADPQATPQMPSSLPPQKKSSSATLILLSLLVFLALVGGGYYFLMVQKDAERVENDVMKEKEVLLQKASPSSEPSEIPLSSSDDIDAIEQDLNNTVVSDDSSLYTEIESDLEGL